MVAWWSPLSDGIQRLVGRAAQPAPEPAADPDVAAVSAPARPSQAWPWQPPVQRVLDPAWAPRLRPDAFATGLTSHQDPSFRRDLGHEVQPSTGGLVNGLADRVPGRPGTQTSTTELAVRPVRPARTEVQRSVTPFASWSASDAGAGELTTVGVQPPWAAEAGESLAPSTSVAPVEPASLAPTVPVEPAPSSRSGSIADVLLVDGARVLPVSAAPAVPRPAAPDLPAVRSLPVVQRSPVPAGPVSSAAPSPTVVGRPAPAGYDAEPTTGRAADPAPDTAPLSGFSAAIERLSGPVQTEAPTVDQSGYEGVVAGPVVPGRRVEPAGVGGSSGSAFLDTDSPPEVQLDVQREVVADPAHPVPAPTTEPEAAPAPMVDRPPEVVPTPVAPLVGTDVAHHAERVEPPAQQRSAYAGLPVVPVARDNDDRDGGFGAVPRLAVVRSAPSGPPSGSSPVQGSASWAGVSTHVPTLPAVVSRSLASSRSTPTTVVGVARPETARRTAPLTGTRPTAVQRQALAPAAVADAVAPPAQPLRFGSVAAPGVHRSSAPIGGPGAVASDVLAEPSLQRSSAWPAVAPGLVGPGPVAPPRPSEAFEPGPDAPGLRTASVLDPVERGADHPEWHPSANHPVQRLAAPPAFSSSAGSAPATRPVTVRALGFDQMFGGTTEPGGSRSSRSLEADLGWTTVDLPVVGDVGVQRAVETAAMTAEPVPADPTPSAPSDPTAPFDTAAPSVTAPPAPDPAAAPPAAAPAGADLDEMARRLFDPLSARLRAELWLDRERAGLVSDARF